VSLGRWKIHEVSSDHSPGWCFSASFLYAVFTSAAVASLRMLSVLYGSILVGGSGEATSMFASPSTSLMRV